MELGLARAPLLNNLGVRLAVLIVGVCLVFLEWGCRVTIMMERELDGVLTVDYHHSLLRARQSMDQAVVQVCRTRLELVHLMACHNDGALFPGIELLLQCSLRRELLLQDLLNRRSSVVDDLVDVVLRLHPGTVDL